jgi:hypothetical protein
MARHDEHNTKNKFDELSSKPGKGTSHMPDDITKRLNYFDRQFLRANDFQTEQAYHIYRRRLHYRIFHTVGLGSGLTVTREKSNEHLTNYDQVKVSEGMALDSSGREIILLQPSFAPSVASSSKGPGLPTETTQFYLYLKCDEKTTDASIDPGVTGYTRVTEQAQLLWLLEGERDANAVVLAKVTWDPQSLFAQPVDCSVRAGSVVGSSTTFPQLSAGDINVGGNATVGATLSVTGKVSALGALTVTGNVGIGMASPDRPLTIQAQGTGQELISFKDPSGATKWHINQDLDGSKPGLNFVETLVADGRLFLKAGGNVGIGTTTPGARLDVAGDAKFNGPLNVQGALTASGLEVRGIAKIGGDLSVTGKLTAASFTGDGAGLINVTPADSSVSASKLVPSADSLGKVSGGKMVISGDNVGIGTANPGARLDVAGDAKFNGPLNVQGALTASGLAVSGIAKIGGDLSVMGKLSAASFTGDGAGLSNVIPADSSVSANKLVPSADSLSKVSGGTMFINGGNVGIGIPTAPGFKLDIGDRIRLRQGNSGTAGIWLFQSAVNADVAFFGMHDDNLIGFYGAFPINHGVGWGLTMRTDNGDVQIAGKLTAVVKSFKIDHPLDPANKYLSHSSVESPDVMNIYNGNIITDPEGNATVVLPDYFEALNGDFRYQLTVIGKLAQATVDSEIEHNRFTVKTNQPNVKVSWQVTGIRQDASAKAHRLPVEEDKPEAERGLFLHPEDYGQPKTKGIAFVRSPQRYNANAWPSKP